MLKQKEFDYHLNDSGAKVLVCLESLYESVAKEVLSDTSVEHVFTTSELDFLPVGTAEDLALLWDASRRWFEDVPDCWRRSALQSRPREAEDTLYEYLQVMEAAAIGGPAEYRGETVRAFVAPKEGGDVTEEELNTFCKERMADYKYPR